MWVANIEAPAFIPYNHSASSFAVIVWPSKYRADEKMQTEPAVSSEKTTSDDLKLNGNISEVVKFILLTTEYL
jgi:hypothetical protein